MVISFLVGNKYFKKFSVLILNIILLTSFIYAQDRNNNLSPGYFIDNLSGEPRFVQRFSWRGDEYSYRYEVIIEKNENDLYIPHTRNFTSSNFIEVSLPHGMYRFKVIPYDIFNSPGVESEWRDIEVRHAIQPEFSASKAEVIPGENDIPLGFIINITGVNINPDAVFFLLNPNNTRTVLENIELDNNDNIKIFIENDNLDYGVYDVIIRNPGGLEVSLGTEALSVLNRYTMIIDLQDEINLIEEIVNEKVVIDEIIDSGNELDLDIEVSKFNPLKNILFKFGTSWTPSFPLYGDYYDKYIPIFFNTIRISTIFKISNMYIGPEFTADWNNDSLYTGLSLKTEKWLPNERFAIGIYTGMMFQTLRVIEGETYFNSSSPELFQDTAVISMGTYVSLRIFNRLLLDTGINYLHVYDEISSGTIRPFAGLSLQF